VRTQHLSPPPFLPGEDTMEVMSHMEDS
jgi:hypothetical protein